MLQLTPHPQKTPKFPPQVPPTVFFRILSNPTDYLERTLNFWILGEDSGCPEIKTRGQEDG